MNINKKRNSSDVVNATLLEVFILLAFMLMIVAAATNEQVQKLGIGNKEREKFYCKRNNAPCDDLIAKLEAEIVELESKLRETSPKEGLKSKIPPTCADNQVIMEMTLHGLDRIGVSMNLDVAGHRQGEKQVVSLASLGKYYRDILDDARKKECVYRIRVHDTETINKRDLKLAFNELRSNFRIPEALR